jgi:hypothetical protein
VARHLALPCRCRDTPAEAAKRTLRGAEDVPQTCGRSCCNEGGGDSVSRPNTGAQLRGPRRPLANADLVSCSALFARTLPTEEAFGEEMRDRSGKERPHCQQGYATAPPSLMKARELDEQVSKIRSAVCDVRQNRQKEEA